MIILINSKNEINLNIYLIFTYLFIIWEKKTLFSYVCFDKIMLWLNYVVLNQNLWLR